MTLLRRPKEVNFIGITGQWHQLFCDEIEEPNNFSLNSVVITITRN